MLKAILWMLVGAILGHYVTVWYARQVIPQVTLPHVMSVPSK